MSDQTKKSKSGARDSQLINTRTFTHKGAARGDYLEHSDKGGKIGKPPQRPTDMKNPSK